MCIFTVWLHYDATHYNFNGFLFSVKFLPVKRTSSSLDSSLKVVEIHVYKGDDRHLYETGSHEVEITNVFLYIYAF